MSHSEGLFRAQGAGTVGSLAYRKEPEVLLSPSLGSQAKFPVRVPVSLAGELLLGCCGSSWSSPGVLSWPQHVAHGDLIFWHCQSPQCSLRVCAVAQVESGTLALVP